MLTIIIIGELQFHLHNSHCKLIILGGSHDNGYVRILNSIATEGYKTERVALLEGIPFGREYTDLPFERLQFPNLFMTKHLGHYLHSVKYQPLLAQLAQQRPDLPPPYTNTTTIGSQSGSPTAPVPNISTEPHIVPTLPLMAESRVTNPSTPSNPEVFAPKPIKRPPVPTPKPAVLKNILRLKPPPCYDFYLPDHPDGGTGPCWNERMSKENCNYSHQYRFSVEDFDALKFHALRIRCFRGRDCQNQRCFKGHECPSLKCRGCAFKPEEHRPGTYQPRELMQSPAPDTEHKVEQTPIADISSVLYASSSAVQGALVAEQQILQNVLQGQVPKKKKVRPT